VSGCCLAPNRQFFSGYVEAWDQHHDIVGMEELSHDIYDDVQIEQIDEHCQ
jgi:hypothetical protein